MSSTKTFVQSLQSTPDSPDAARCVECHRPVPQHRRKYCDLHGPQASKLRKREVRRVQNRAYQMACQQGLRAQSPHLNGWASREAYNAYYRDAMRRSRARKKLREAKLIRLEQPVTRVA